MYNYLCGSTMRLYKNHHKLGFSKVLRITDQRCLNMSSICHPLTKGASTTCNAIVMPHLGLGIYFDYHVNSPYYK